MENPQKKDNENKLDDFALPLKNPHQKLFHDAYRATDGEPANLPKVGIEVAGTLTGSTVGAVAWSLATRRASPMLTRVLITALTSGTARAGIQAGLESACLDKKDRSNPLSNFGWGTVDGFAGVAGVAAEARMSRLLTPAIGRQYLGNVSTETAMVAGERAIENSLAAKFKFNISRGVTGGTVGSFVWSVPHELHGHMQRQNATLGDTLNRVKEATLMGGLTGGILAAGFTSAANGSRIFDQAMSRLSGGKNLSHVDILHFNDLHSSLVGKKATLPQLATMVDDVRTQVGKQGRPVLLYEAGDNFSGNVAAGFTDTGYVETKAVNMMKPDGFIPGNHVADAGNGSVNIDAWVHNLRRIRGELNRDVPAIATNIELPKYPGFAGQSGDVYKPYRLVNVPGPNGTVQRVGVLGLVTEELADAAKVGDIRYHDATQTAAKWVNWLRKPVEEGGAGVNQVHVISHLGRSADIELAKKVPGITYIAGAHSHDAEPVLMWVRHPETGWEVPVMQAGSSGRWLAHSKLAVRPDGSADRARTTGKLIEIGADVPPNPTIKGFVDQHVGKVNELEAMKYPANVTEAFTIHGIRGQHARQTPLGSLVSEAVLEGVNRRLPSINAERAAGGLQPLPPMNIMLKHTGDIRAGVEAGVPSHRALSDVFLNTGSVERETNELAAAVLKGADIEKVLNFGVADLPGPAQVGGNGRFWGEVKGTTRQLFMGPKPEPAADFTGNFIQTHGLKYQIDLSKAPGSRVSGVEVLDPKTNRYVPIDPNAEYPVLTLFHPIEKWGKNGVFGPQVRAGGEAAARDFAKAQPIKLSQVEMLAEHLQRKGAVSPHDYLTDNITDLTPATWRAEIRPSLSTMGAVSVMPVQMERAPRKE